jgi:hypothetical protein
MGRARSLRTAAASLVVLVALGCATPPDAASPRAGSGVPPLPHPGIVYVRERSAILSRFFAKDVFHEATVVLPPKGSLDETLPIVYTIHGFGGSHWEGWRSGGRLRAKMRTGGYPRMLYVFLDGNCARGHHVFADSENNGPRETAFTTELLPLIEERFGGTRDAERRFVTGHSSGGWASLWLLVRRPDLFAGAWAVAPDSVDFRAFDGFDVYSAANAYVHADGSPVMLVRRGGRWIESLESFVRREGAHDPTGGAFASFDAAFSPRGAGGQPRPLFDRATGTIDRDVARHWCEHFDISSILRRRWLEIGPRLAGKLHVWVGDEDSYGLDAACRLLREELDALGARADFLFAPGRDHVSLMAPHPTLWPGGLVARAHREMAAQAANAP